MRVLVACEFSQVVCKAFRERGHEAYSCDILPTEGNPAWHIQDDVLKHLDDGWDLMIAHPPCTRLAKAGGWCWKYKEAEINEAFQFVLKLWNARIKKIGLENPIGWLNTHWQKPTQIIHPYYFGDPYLKETSLWLKNLPPLIYFVKDNLCYTKTSVEPKANWVKPGNKRDRRFNQVPEGGNRNSHDRSRFFPSIANAMAEQWG